MKHGEANEGLANPFASSIPWLPCWATTAACENIHEAIAKAHAEEYSGMEVCTLVSTSGKTYRCDLWAECIHNEDSPEDSFFCDAPGPSPERRLPNMVTMNPVL